MNTEKTCNTCGILKKIEQYTNNRRYKDGKENRCKECVKKNNQSRKEQLSKSQKNWRLKNPEYMKKYEKNPERIEKKKQYYIENAESYKERKRNYRKENPEKEREARQKYTETHKELINEYHRKWKQNKRNNDVHYKLKENTSRRIRYELNNFFEKNKSKKTIEYIGCSVDELKVHLENLFDENMNWNNYGSYWHIDHIIPCSAWDLSKEEDNFYCWNFMNLRPLEASKNRSKKDKYDYLDKKIYIENFNLKHC